MNTAIIIEQIDAEIYKLQQAKVLLTVKTTSSTKNSPRHPKTNNVVSKSVAAMPAKRVVSAEAKAKMAEAQKARWAKVRKQEKKAVNAIAKVKAAKKAAKAAAVKSDSPAQA
jgi:hypothetical protein